MKNNAGIVCSVSQHQTLSSWILDIGAIAHVCHSRVKFQCHRRIRLVLVNLPDGSQMTSHMAETVLFSNQLFLHDVLYIPSFTFNLISVSKLANSLDCHLIFNGASCMIQDIHTLRMIGVAESRDGLYYLTAEILQHLPNSIKSFHSTACSIWHLTFGHPHHMKNQNNYTIIFLSLYLTKVINLVTLVNLLGKRDYLFLIVLALLIVILICYIWIFGSFGSSVYDRSQVLPNYN